MTFPSPRSPRTCHSVEDLRLAAQGRLPRLLFDYVDGGAHSETTMRANAGDFAQWRLMPRILRNVQHIDLSTRFMGACHRLPFWFAPVGYLGLLAPRGDIAAGRVAREAGTVMGISTFSIAPLEEIAGAAGQSACQLYMVRDRAITRDILDRAKSAGISDLILTVDTPVTPLRPRDARNGFRAVTRFGARHVLDMVRHPRWLADMARNGPVEAGNIARYDLGKGILEQSARLGREIDPRLVWDDLDWLRGVWSGRLYVKGVLHPGDARACRDHGADGVIVSNHGGRQLDFAPSAISCLPAVREAVGPDCEVLFDSGVRRGTDVVMALALGADAVALGRACAYGLGAFGEAGVARAVDLLREDIASTLALMGLASIDELKAQSRDEIIARITP